MTDTTVDAKLKQWEMNMGTETLHCGKRTYLLEARVTKNGHKYMMITEKSSGRMSKVMVFHDHFDTFREAFERIMKTEPTEESEVTAHARGASSDTEE